MNPWAGINAPLVAAGTGSRQGSVVGFVWIIVAAETGSRRVGFTWTTSVGGPSFEDSACCPTAFVHFSLSKGSQCDKTLRGSVCFCHVVTQYIICVDVIVTMFLSYRRSSDSLPEWAGVQLPLGSLRWKRVGPASPPGLVTGKPLKENSLGKREGRRWLKVRRRPATTQHFVQYTPRQCDPLP